MSLFRKRETWTMGADNQPESPTPPPTPEPTKTVPMSSYDVPSIDNAELAVYSTTPEFNQVLDIVQQSLASDMLQDIDVSDLTELKARIAPIMDEAVASLDLIVGRSEREQMLNQILADTVGFGPIQPLLERDDISEIMVNGPEKVYIEKDGRLYLTDVRFRDDDHVLRIIERIVTPLGRRIDQASPMVDARLPDGSRVNAIIPPLSLVGPTLTIRKFKKAPLHIDDLIRYGTLTEESARFLEACVRARLNIIVSGGTGSGKTTTLGVLSAFIPEDERIITIEDAAELRLQQPHVVRLESRPPNVEGKGGIGIRELFVNSLRMRPDRIVVGECRGAEALYMLQAMNTGHDGSITTIHSNGPRDTLARIETMVMMAGMPLTMRAIRQQIASAVDLIVHISRMRDGTRKIVAISEILGMETDTIIMQDIYQYVQEGFNEKGRVLGELRPTGIRPSLMSKIETAGITLPPEVFGLRMH